MYSQEWKCTDPDNQQYGRQISFSKFEFKEKEKWAFINLSEFDDLEIEYCIKSYGYYCIEDIFKMCGKDSLWIIAECLFELNMY